jgi:sporulation protein YlmC with PRC-barrel domain
MNGRAALHALRRGREPTAAGDEQRIGGEQPVGSGARTLIRSQTLVGRGVVNVKGEDLGRIEEFVIDPDRGHIEYAVLSFGELFGPDRGHIEYAVLSFGELFGLGEKFFAVPWEALRIDDDRGHFIMDVEKETLEEGQGFDPETWPPAPDRRIFTRE